MWLVANELASVPTGHFYHKTEHLTALRGSSMPQYVLWTQQQHRRACWKSTISVLTSDLLTQTTSFSEILRWHLGMLRCERHKSTLHSLVTSSGLPSKPPHKHRLHEFSMQYLRFVNLFPVSGSIDTSWNTDKIQWGTWQFLNPPPSCLSHATLGRIPFKATDLL